MKRITATILLIFISSLILNNFLTNPSQQAEQDVVSHPILRLHKEYNLLTKSLGPLAASIIAHADKRSERIRSIIQSLGTETGRICFRTPPLQMVNQCDCTTVLHCIVLY